MLYKANPIRNGYTFSGWDVESYEETRIVFIAKYSVNKYIVTFKDYDGTVIDTSEVEYSKSAIAPVNPTREGYAFTGWDKSYNNITNDLEVTARYEINKYTVTFRDYDGRVLSSQEIEYGQSAIEPEKPYREGYEFKNWSLDFTNINKNTTIRAQYEQLVENNDDDKDLEEDVEEDIEEDVEEEKYYTVKFMDEEGNIFDIQEVKLGDDAISPEDPIKMQYIFKGWVGETSNITKDTEIIAVFEKENDNTIVEEPSNEEESNNDIGGSSEEADNNVDKDNNVAQSADMQNVFIFFCLIMLSTIGMNYTKSKVVKN